MATGLEKTAVSPHTMRQGNALAPAPVNSLAQTAVNPLAQAYQAYQQYIGQPFQQAVRGGIRGYFGLPMMTDASTLGRDAYGQGVALSNVPGVGTPAGAAKVAAQALGALPEAAMFMGALGAKSGAAKTAENYAERFNALRQERAEADRVMKEYGLYQPISENKINIDRQVGDGKIRFTVGFEDVYDFDAPQMSWSMEAFGDVPIKTGAATEMFIEALDIAKQYGASYRSDSILSEASENLHKRLEKQGVKFLKDGNSYVLTAEELANLDLPSIAAKIASSYSEKK